MYNGKYTNSKYYHFNVNYGFVINHYNTFYVATELIHTRKKTSMLLFSELKIIRISIKKKIKKSFVKLVHQIWKQTYINIAN